MGKSENNVSELSAEGLRIAVIASRYNPKICEGLLEGSLQELERLGLPRERVVIRRVPGAFEIPLLAKKLAQSNKFDGLICLGAIIRGETSHFEYVCQGATQGIQQAMLETGIPMAFGVLTTEDDRQALVRASQDVHNKGLEAARTAVEMVRLTQKI